MICLHRRAVKKKLYDNYAGTSRRTRLENYTFNSICNPDPRQATAKAAEPENCAPPRRSPGRGRAAARGRASRPCPLRARRRTGSAGAPERSEEHTSELQSLMRISYAVFCLKKKKTKTKLQSTSY